MTICIVILHIWLTGVGPADTPVFHQLDSNGGSSWVRLSPGDDFVLAPFPCRGESYDVWITAGDAATDVVTVVTPDAEGMPEASEWLSASLALTPKALYLPFAIAIR